MTKDGFENAEHDATHATAADWFARLQDPDLSLDATLTWQSWMSEDERHARAFRRIEETWNRFRDMPRPALPTAAVLASDRYDGATPVSNWLALKRAPRPTSRAFKLALAASIVIAMMGAAAFLHFNEPRSIIETAVGENHTVRLADGSKVALGGRTRVTIVFDAEARRLTLDRGEALFTVSKDPKRPFSVRAGPTTVTAIGTEFNVRRARDRVVVAVVEGRVLVEPREPIIRQLPLLHKVASQDQGRRHLNAGDKTTISRGGLESLTHVPDSGAATAWQTGRLAFEREPLRYVLEDVNRYAPKPIVLGDDGIGSIKVTGTVLSDNIKGWVNSLESAFGLQATEERARIVLTKHEPR